MQKKFSLESFINEIRLLADKAPPTEVMTRFLVEADYHSIVTRGVRILKNKVQAATDPWSEVQYQSLYLRGNDPADRVVLQEPAVQDPAVCVIVLKAARLSGESGMVFCGVPAQLKAFAAKLPEYEKRGVDLDEGEFLECLIEAAEAEGLRVIFQRLSEDHGGEPEDDDE